ncbi:DUF4850 domain-containing protein [Paenibacillus sp. 1P07SE]|uniref:DUF4850 domain-containing protein n=1 Tax=Paenibacillus sp. 1P07SE TaxID=3132209 RepID=UPI0039A53C82
MRLLGDWFASVPPWSIRWLSFLAEHSGVWLQRLLTASVSASAVIGLILLIRLLLRGKLPIGWQYALWGVLLIRLLIPWSPESTFSLQRLVPAQLMQLVPAEGTAQERLLADNGNLAVDQLPAVIPDNGYGGEDAAAVVPPAESESAVNSTPPVDGAASAGTAGGFSDTASRFAPGVSFWALWIWLAGAALVVCRLIIHLTQSRRLVRRSVVVLDEELPQLLEASGRRLGLRRLPRLRVSEELNSPVLVGVFRPVLILPSPTLLQLEREEWHCIFLHELVHCKRRDPAINWLMALAAAVHWFNPFVWYAVRGMRDDQELSCDDQALRSLDTPSVHVYGHTMIRLLEQAQRRSAPSITAFSDGYKTLRRRIEGVRTFRPAPYRNTAAGAVLLLVVALVSLTSSTGGTAGEESQPLPEMAELGQIRLETNELYPDTLHLPLIGIRPDGPDGSALPASLVPEAGLPPIILSELPEKHTASWAGFWTGTGFYDQGILLLAPRHWQAEQADLAADGSITVVLVDPEDPLQRLTYYDTGTCVSCVLPLLAAYYPDLVSAEDAAGIVIPDLPWISREAESEWVRYRLAGTQGGYLAAGVGYRVTDYRDGGESKIRFRQLTFEGPTGDEELAREMLAYFEARQLIGEFLYMPDTEPVAVTGDGDVKLYGLEKRDGMHLGYHLELEGRGAVFDWKGMIDVTGEPQMVAEDINGDGRAEIVVATTLGRGTGVSIQEVHVVNPVTLEEVAVEDPVAAMEGAMDSRIEVEDDRTYVYWSLPGEDGTLEIDYEVGYPNEEMLFGSHVSFGVKNGRLTASVVGSIAINEFTGNFVLDYRYDGEGYVVDRISYDPQI